MPGSLRWPLTTVMIWTGSREESRIDCTQRMISMRRDSWAVVGTITVTSRGEVGSGVVMASGRQHLQALQAEAFGAVRPGAEPPQRHHRGHVGQRAGAGAAERRAVAGGGRAGGTGGRAVVGVVPG